MIKKLISMLCGLALVFVVYFGIYSMEPKEPVKPYGPIYILSEAKHSKYDLNSDASFERFLDDEHPFIQKDYVPEDLTQIVSDFTFNNSKKFLLRREAGVAFADMAWHFWNAFEGKKRLSINSSYRSYVFQNQLAKNCSAKKCAKAGTSEHQAGLALDLGVNGGNLDLKSLQRLQENAHKWGFHQSYQKGISIDGKEIEPWHWRYMGTRLATELYEQKKSFTEWFYAQQGSGKVLYL